MGRTVWDVADRLVEIVGGPIVVGFSLTYIGYLMLKLGASPDTTYGEGCMIFGFIACAMGLILVGKGIWDKFTDRF